MNDELSQDYQAALEKVVFYPQPEAGYLRIAGEDRVNFIQRQTTNDVHLLQPPRALLSVLTSPVARILDVFYLLDEVDAIGALTLPGFAHKTADFLRSRIFFMDRVSVKDLSQRIAQYDLFGPQAQNLLQQLGIQAPALNQVSDAEIAGKRLRILALEKSFGPGYRMILTASDGETVEAALRQNGALCLSADSFEALRVETGQPQADKELSEEYTPLEAGLFSAIADGKGCYTGQEIIARQLTYDKVTQQLCGLRLSELTPAGERIYAEGKPAGTLTSFAHSPRFGPIALAILKRPYFQPGTQVALGNAASESQAVVTALPFQA
ncbi:MAG: glycine cleavage T C-terminal barrel domain-containing protein [Anaerolineales bacterium]|jgi:folate-binding protein YgfZ